MVTIEKNLDSVQARTRVDAGPAKLFIEDYSLPKAALSPKATIFLPGWAMRGDSRALKAIGNTMARVRSESRAFTISTRPLRGTVGENEETEGIALFIKGKEIKHVTLLGYSEGATRAISLANILQEQGITVDGIGLLSPMGIVDQKRREVILSLMKAVSWDIPTNTVHYIWQHKGEYKAFFRGMQAASGVAKGLFEEITLRRGSYLSSLKTEVSEVSRRNPFVETLSMPVVIVIGEKDTVVRRDTLQKAVGGLRAQTQIKLLTAKKLGSHGLAFVRPECTISASLHALSRLRR